MWHIDGCVCTVLVFYKTRYCVGKPWQLLSDLSSDAIPLTWRGEGGRMGEEGGGEGGGGGGVMV